jgi:hypothetical protein
MNIFTEAKHGALGVYFLHRAIHATHPADQAHFESHGTLHLMAPSCSPQKLEVLRRLVAEASCNPALALKLQQLR